MHRPPTSEEEAVLQEMVESIHQQFVNDIAASRTLTTEEVSLLADGRMYLGQAALKNGLVDQLGGLHETLVKSRQMANLPENEICLYLDEESGLLSGLITLSMQSLRKMVTGNTGFRIRF
jgi:ClpP class serine protease